MTLNITVLILSALIGGSLPFLLKEVKEKNLKVVLVFAGAYLFSITVIHILPELFINEKQSSVQIGLFVLVGFFLQQILEYFSSGTEHGHIHIHDESHHHKKVTAFYVVAALCIHAFLEGTLLAHPSEIHVHHDSKALLAGIGLHKLPAAFALMSVLLCYLQSRNLILVMLLIFTLASPAGLLISDYLFKGSIISDEAFIILFAIVAGNFLHISTTIVFESTPGHKFDGKRLLVSILGAGVAVMAEYFV